MFRTPSSVTPASLTPPTSGQTLTRTATLLRNALWLALLVTLVAGVILYFRYAPHIVPMVGGNT